MGRSVAGRRTDWQHLLLVTHMDNTFDFLLSVSQAIEAQIESELQSLSTPVGNGSLDARQWCIDTSMTRCIPIWQCVEHLRTKYGIIVDGLSCVPTQSGGFKH